MKLDDDKILTLLIHNILTTPIALYEMEDWLKPLDAEKVGLSPQETSHYPRRQDRHGACQILSLSAQRRVLSAWP